jgi:hypothetical protein
MKIKLRTVYANEKGAFQPGEIKDLPNSEAIELIKGGFATPIKDHEAEVAMIKPAETMVTKSIDPIVKQKIIKKVSNKPVTKGKK